MNSEKKLFGRISYRHLIRGMWALVLLGLFIAISLFIFVAHTKMPDTKALEHPTFEESSIVFSDDMVEIDRYFKRNRQWVKYDDLSPHLIDALMATEDIRFFKHSGIDARGTARAIASLGSNGGGSTITQQLAKQFFTEKRSSFFPRRVWQKMQEWVIAVEFERRYTKEEVLAMFLNKFDFLNQANGIGAAANIYFGKDQKELTIPEAATLIGMLKNPNLYNPIRAADRSIRIRNVILSQMRRYKFISNAEYDIYKNESLDMSGFSRGENFNGLAPHFMAELKQALKKLLIEQGLTKPGGIKYNLDTDGLEIYTTIDSRYQEHAEAAARAHMIVQQKTFEKVWKDKDPWTYFDSEDDLTEDDIKRQKKQRNNILLDLVEKTDRYKKMRYAYLNNVINEITKEIPEARLWKGDITRLLSAEKDDSFLDKLIEDNYISQNQKKVYLQVLSSAKWEILKTQWRTLTSETKRVFNKKRKMTIYSHTGLREVEMSPLDSVKYMTNFLQIGSISMDPKTGYIKSWIGGANYNIWKYDHVTTSRQVGSTFKPFLYTAALNNAISPCMKVWDTQYTIPAGEPPFKLTKTWEPKNSRGSFTEEEVTLKDGLKLSMNSVSVYLVKELGSLLPVVQIAENMGIAKGKIEPYPSIILGTPTLSVLEMTTAYSTYANNGLSPKPIFIKKIVHEGVTIYEAEPENRRTLNEDVNYAMVQLLKYAASAVGYRLQTDFGGKTGTTNDHVDGWFMGITPNLVTGTWVGGQYNWIRFLSLNEGQGGRMARPFFLNYMGRLEADETINQDLSSNFSVPEEINIEVNCEAYEQIEESDLPEEPFDDLESSPNFN